MASRDLKHVRALVTGCSSGIGKAFVEALLPYQPQVVIVARRMERLLQLVEKGQAQHAQVYPYACDLADPAGRLGAVAFAAEKLGALDLLVNNAGTGALGRFEDTPPEILRQVMELNFFAPVELTYHALPLLRKGMRPIIVNVSSILGHRGIPWRAYYCASKFALQGFSEAIRAELSRYGIDVLVVSPGRTRTELFDGPLERGKEPAWPEPRPVSAEFVARQMVRAIKLGKNEIIPHVWGKGMVFLSRCFPRLMDRILRRFA